ncbi:MAG: sodium-dependent transporter, partial [Victivallaceae bacterium]|nr:sodium-dependent transporter [Victivallaceae bacterium]
AIHLYHQTLLYTSKIGYVLAASGSAVGLGNIWRFPYLAAKHGGGIFLLTYLVCALTFGYALLIAESGIGRMTGKGPIGAYRDFCAEKKGLLKIIGAGGWINALVPLIVLPYYCVIGGWVIKYIAALAGNPIAVFAKDVFVTGADGGQVSASADYFSRFIASTREPLGCFLLFMGILAAVVSSGVQKGVERFNKILMPLLIVMIVAICIYCCFLPGAQEGLCYYLAPDVSKFSFMTVIAAMGQLFYSLSIAMGVMITYGAYMRREDDLVSCVNQIEFFDTAVAFFAGLMIIPPVVSFGGKAAAENAGAGLIFITMPQVFASIPCGRIVGVVFFLLVLFAAATSAVSLLETDIHSCCQELKISRRSALAVVVAEAALVGCITVLGYSVLSDVRPLAFIRHCAGMNILDALDFLCNSILIPVAAIFTTLLVVAVIGLKRFSAEIGQGKPWRRAGVFRFCMRWTVAPCLLLILLYSTGFFDCRPELRTR